MEWNDVGLILGTRKHGETSAIVEIMTREHGRHMGLVRGGRSKRMRPILQPGNFTSIHWRARLEEHLGMFQLEAEKLNAAELMANPVGIHGIQTLASHLRLLPERDPHEGLYEAAQVIIDNFKYPEACASLMIRFEVVLLEELGFGLDLSKCAANGQIRELVYVSPKSGRAVCAQEGRPYAERMLNLPSFLNRHEEEWGTVPHSDALEDGFKLTGFFLERHIYGPRGITPPAERLSYMKHILKAKQNLVA